MTDLDDQLKALIDRHGAPAVRQRANALTKKSRLRVPKRSASEYVAAMSLPAERKNTMLRLARLFEERRFLPGAGDIRNLMEAFGGEAMNGKNRQAMMPGVFRFLCSLSDKQLERILTDELFTGPSELGPIADAIKDRSGRDRPSNE